MKADNKSVRKRASAQVQGDIAYFQEVSTSILMGNKPIKYKKKSSSYNGNNKVFIERYTIG